MVRRKPLLDTPGFTRDDIRLFFFDNRHPAGKPKPVSGWLGGGDASLKHINTHEPIF